MPPTSSVHTFWGCGLRAFQVLLRLLVFLARYPRHQATRHHSCRHSACLHSLHEPSVVVVMCSRDWTREDCSPSLCFLKSPQCAACSAPEGVCITVYPQLCLKFPSIDRDHQRSSRETSCPGSRPQGGSFKGFLADLQGCKSSSGGLAIGGDFLQCRSGSRASEGYRRTRLGPCCCSHRFRM